MEYKQVKHIMDENAQLKAEIERLKADMQEIIDLSYAAFPVLNMRYVAERALGQSEPPQESLTPAELGELAGKAEMVEEPLKVRILQALAKRGRLGYGELNHETGESLFLDDYLSKMKKDGLIYHPLDENFWYFYTEITADGRDYLASLEAAKAE